MSILARATPVLLLATVVVSGCDGDGEEHAGEEHTEAADSAHETAEHGEEAEHGGEQGEHSGCAAEERDDAFAIGLSKSGELVTATFVSATPAPPIKGDNVWLIDLTTLDGEPLDGVSLTVVPMMPDHGHGTPVVTVVTPTEVSGRYELSDVNMFMTGLWEVSFELTLAGGEQDTLVFGFCVE